MISTILSLGCQSNRRVGKTSTFTSLWCHFRNSMFLLKFGNYFNSGCPYRSYAPQFRSRNRFCYRFRIFLADAHVDPASRCQAFFVYRNFNVIISLIPMKRYLLLGWASEIYARWTPGASNAAMKSSAHPVLMLYSTTEMTFMMILCLKNGLVWIDDAPHRHSSSGIEFVT